MDMIFQNGFAVYNGDDQGHTTIPGDISVTETVINLIKNSITSLGPNEFSEYTSLEDLRLNDNDITTIDPSAFSGTQLKILYLERNKLAEFPDLSVVSGTLEELGLTKNPITTVEASRLNLPNVQDLSMYNTELTHWPDFSQLGINRTGISLGLNLKIKYPDNVTNITNVCHIRSVTLLGQREQFIPPFQCPAGSPLNSINLGRAKVDDTADFEHFSHLESLRSLYLHENRLTKMPHLPIALRESLEMLSLLENPITSIDPSALEGFKNLNTLNLQNTKLTYVPAQVFQVSLRISCFFFRGQLAHVLAKVMGLVRVGMFYMV